VTLVEMESLQLVSCLWSIGLIGLDTELPKINLISTESCALRSPSLVSSSTHPDAPGVPSVAGYVAIPPRALSDPDLCKFSDSLLSEPTDTVLTGPVLALLLPFTCAPARSQIWSL